MSKTLQKDKLAVTVFETRDEMGKQAAKDIAACMKQLLAQKEEINMIFAAAPSQNDMLLHLCEEEGIDWTRVNAFHMDEYVGLPQDAPQGFGNFLRAHIFDRKPFKSVHCIDSAAGDAAEECRRYTDLLNRYPTDIACLGIGENGHIAFNDPHVALFDDPETVKIVSLDQVCRMQQVNDGCFRSIDEVPTHALTLTVPTLFRADYIFCVVPAPTKANAVERTVNGEITTACPASILRTHDRAILYCDADSAAKLNL